MLAQLVQIFFGANVLALATLLARQVELRWPIDATTRQREIVEDWKATATNLGLAWLLEPLTGACGAALVSALGGGFIHLRTDGWWYAASLAGYVVASDLYRYWFHRLQHAVPFLWALHSFHHSAEALTFITGGRHHWIERALVSAFLPILPLVFRMPPEMAGIVGFIFFLPDSCAHLNIRFPMGRAITWLNSPQWHRIHHSVRPEHFDRNFASLLPLWDVVFGTAWVPARDEYPSVGLVPSERVGIFDSIVWPFRRHVRGWTPPGRLGRPGRRRPDPGSPAVG